MYFGQDYNRAERQIIFIKSGLFCKMSVRNQNYRTSSIVRIYQHNNQEMEIS